MIELKTNDTVLPKIIVIGIGGGGNNAVNRMIDCGLSNVSYACINTDLHVLQDCKSEYRLQIGRNLTGGNGAGANPAIGEASAKESEEEIINLVNGYDMAILTCGMGGGTGTGAIPIVAKICKELGLLTIAIVTTPFTFESQPRMIAASNGLEQLKENIDTLLIIPNDKLLKLTDKKIFLEDAFDIADTVLRYTINGITHIIYNKGIINLDFNDIKTTLCNKGICHLGIGIVDEGSSITEAVNQAINSPLLETSISGATNILINTSGHIDLFELNEAITYVRELAGPDSQIIWGTVTDAAAETDKIVVTLIATGMDEKKPAPNMYIPLPKKSLTHSTGANTTLPVSHTYAANAYAATNARVAAIPKNIAVKPPVASPMPELVIPSFLAKKNNKE